MGGVRYVTSVATLRSRPGSMLDAMFSGRYNIEEEDGSGAFLDRDGGLFAHILAYLRDGVVAVGCEEDVVMLGRLKREFGYYCLELVQERALVLAVGGTKVTESSAEAYDVERGCWQVLRPCARNDV